MLHQTKEERRRFSRSGLCLTCNVSTRECDRKCARLNRRAALEARLGNAAHQFFAQAQLFEGELSEVRL